MKLSDQRPEVRQMWVRLWGDLTPAVVHRMYKRTHGALLDKTQKGQP